MSALTEDVETTIQELEGNNRLSQEGKSLFKILLHSPLDVAKSYGIESGRVLLATLKKYLSGSLTAYALESEPETKPVTAYAGWDILYDNKHKGMHMEFVI